MPRKPPISFPVGTGCRGFSLLRSITEQVSSSHPLFPKDLPRASYRGLGSPFRSQCPSRKLGDAVISCPPRESPAGQVSSWTKGRAPAHPCLPYPPAPNPHSSGHSPHTVLHDPPLWSATPIPSPSQLLEDVLPLLCGAPDPPRPSLGWVLGWWWAGEQGFWVQGVTLNQDWSSPFSALGSNGSCSLHSAYPINHAGSSLSRSWVGGTDDRERVYTDTNRDRRENWLPEYSILDLPSAASSPSTKRRSWACLTSARGRDPGGWCPLDRVGVMSIPRSRRGVCCSGEGLI